MAISSIYIVVNESSFTCITVRFWGIWCTLRRAIIMLSGCVKGTTVGALILSGCIVLPVAGIGVPVIMVSPLLAIKGWMVSPVVGLTK